MANARRRTQRASRTSTRNSARSSSIVATLDSEESRIGRTVDWQREVKYINQDLRDLLVISIILFVLLFAAGFFL